MICQYAALIFYYSLSLAFASSAAVFSNFGFLASLLCLFVVFFLNYLSLQKMRDQKESTNQFHKLSEQMAALGILVFLPLLFTAGILPALMSLLAFALFALNFQMFDWRRLYMGFGASVALVAVGAAESKSGAYWIYLLGYTVSLSMTLGYAYMLQQSKNVAMIWPVSNRLWIAGLFTSVAFVVYMLIPQLPAGNLGGVQGSDHFYKNPQWETEAKPNSLLKDKSLEDALEDQRKIADSNTNGQSDSGNQATGDRAGDNTNISQELKSDAGSSKSSFDGSQDQFDYTQPDPQRTRFGNGLIAYVKSDRPLYLRTAIFDQFDGIYWQKTIEGSIKLPVTASGLVLYKVPKTDREVRYEVEMVSSIDQTIPLAAVPATLFFPSTAVSLKADGSLLSPGKILSGTRYSAVSWIRQFDKRVYAESAKTEVDYLQLPNDLDQRIPALALEVTQNLGSDDAKAIAIEQYLRTQFTYELESIFTSQHSTPLVPFLFETKKGHCEYFASAAVILLRSLGIPARFVTGFSATQQNPLTGYYEIHALDGHAWVEAYIEGKGWLILEPTAFYDGPWFEPSAFSAQKISDYVKKQEEYRQLKETAGVEAEYSWQDLLGATWQLASDGLVILFAYLKLFFIKSWIYFVALISLWLLIKFSWRWYAAPLMFWWTYQQALKKIAKNPNQTITVSMDASFRLLTLAKINFPAGICIEDFLSDMQSRQLVSDVDQMATAFNQQFYMGDHGGSSDSAVNDVFRRLLKSIYDRGIKQLAEY